MTDGPRTVTSRDTNANCCFQCTHVDITTRSSSSSSSSSEGGKKMTHQRARSRGKSSNHHTAVLAVLSRQNKQRVSICRTNEKRRNYNKETKAHQKKKKEIPTWTPICSWPFNSESSSSNGFEHRATWSASCCVRILKSHVPDRQKIGRIESHEECLARSRGSGRHQNGYQTIHRRRGSTSTVAVAATIETFA